MILGPHSGINPGGVGKKPDGTLAHRMNRFQGGKQVGRTSSK